jgi:hypothetical protein
VLKLGFENRSLGKESLGKETILEFADTRTAYDHTKEGEAALSAPLYPAKDQGEKN